MSDKHYRGDLERVKNFISGFTTMDRFNDPVIKRFALYASAIFFLFGLILSIRANSGIFSHLSACFAGLIVIATVLTIVFSAIEFRLIAALCGGSLSFFEAFETVVIGNAANMLPLPGNILVKVSRLKSVGVRYTQGVSITTLMAVIGLGIVLFYAGFWLVWLDLRVMGFTSIVSGSVVLAAAVLCLTSIFSGWRTISALLLVRATQIFIYATRFYLCFRTLDVAGSFAQASVLTVSSVLGSMAVIVPAGLGVQELLSAGLGPLIGLTAALGFLITSLNRILGMGTTLILSGILVIYTRKRHR